MEYMVGPITVKERLDLIRAANCAGGWCGMCLGTEHKDEHYHAEFNYMIFRDNGMDGHVGPMSGGTEITLSEAHDLIINKEIKMSKANQYKVNPGSQAMLDVLLDSAVARGWGIATRFYYNNFPFLCVRVKEKDVFGCNDQYHSAKDYQTVDVHTITKVLMGEHNRVKMDFMIDNNDVVVYHDKVVVGCKTVSRERIQKILDTMNELRLDK